MSVGLAILKLNTMVTFILTFLAVCIIAVCVGTRIISGIVPSIIHYGLKLFTPSSFLALGSQDVTDTGKIWKSGDTLTFKVRYANMLYAFTGDHVSVAYVHDA